jgi:hypothetical protein
MYIIDEPIITELNNTAYYYTYNDWVYIKITGLNLDKSGTVYVKVNDTS